MSYSSAAKYLGDRYFYVSLLNEQLAKMLDFGFEERKKNTFGNM